MTRRTVSPTGQRRIAALATYQACGHRCGESNRGPPRRSPTAWPPGQDREGPLHAGTTRSGVHPPTDDLFRRAGFEPIPSLSWLRQLTLGLDVWDVSGKRRPLLRAQGTRRDGRLLIERLVGDVEAVAAQHRSSALLVA